jgi:methionyl-tRNA formyltransferase
MKVAIIGRTEILYETINLLRSKNYEIACILTSKEAPEYKCTADDFKDLAYQLKIPFAQGSKISDFYDFLQSVNADISISINYSGIIPQSVVELFPLGILNAHGGDLPRYRGNACQAWAILNGEEHVGLCIHKMIGGELDSGDIITREYLRIDCQTKVTRILEWMASRIPSLMLESLELLSSNSSYFIERQSQNPKIH